MMVIAPLDCNKSIKQKVIYQMHMEYAQENFDKFAAFVTEDYEMDIISRETFYGWNNVKEHLKKLSIKPKKLVLHQILSHGKYGAAHGRYVYDDYEIAFSNFYEFVSVATHLVKKTTSYLVEIKR